MQATFLGHACWLLEAEGVGLLIDPFLTGNPQATKKAEEIRCQYMFLTHAHDDHIADAATIAKRNDALVISTFEVAARVGEGGVRTHGMHIGGTCRFPFGKLRIVPAFHGSGVPGGHAAGLLVEFYGKRVYHAGDTCLFGDMKLIPEVWGGADLALLPIGGNFTMDADDAVVAATWIRPRLAVPMHYGTWPLIEADPEDWARRVRAAGIEALVVRPGESVNL